MDPLLFYSSCFGEEIKDVLVRMSCMMKEEKKTGFRSDVVRAKLSAL